MKTFLGVLFAKAATIGATSIDCYAGFNGGCSHYCNSNQAEHRCECPTCWELDDDNQTCRPASDKVTTQCTMNELIVTSDKCVFGSHDYTTARMLDGDCKFVEDENDSNKLVFKAGLDQCGTVLEFGDDAITYKNTMTVKAGFIEQILYVDPDIEWAFTCSFDTRYEVSKAMAVDDSILEDTFTVTDAKFKFGLIFFQTARFETEQAEANYQVGQQINFAIAMNEGTPLNNLEMVATDCTVSNGNDQSYAIMESNSAKNKCANRGGPINFRSYDKNDAFTGYSYNGFQFVNSAPLEQDLTCSITVCHKNNADSDCKKFCYADDTSEPVVPQPVGGTLP